MVLFTVGNLHFKHAGKNVLVPQPSDDSTDPLNWGVLWKGFIMAGMTINTFAWTVGPLSISSQVPYYMEEWNRPLSDIIQFVSPETPSHPVLMKFLNRETLTWAQC